MPARVLDCNVLAAANGMATHQPLVCQASSAEALRTAAKGLVLVDDDDVILGAYRGKTNRSGQPGPAEVFYRWLMQVRSDRRHCRVVPLSRDASGEYADYPRDAEFVTFDRDDRVYAAVAIASGLRPDIINSTDSDWLDVTHALERYGIRVRNLCVPLVASPAGRE